MFPQAVVGFANNKVRTLSADLDTTPLNTNYNVTVYVGPGDYFLFSCFNKFVEHYACEM